MFNKVRGEGLDSITRRYSGNERTLLSGNQSSRPKVISPETRVMSPKILSRSLSDNKAKQAA